MKPATTYAEAQAWRAYLPFFPNAGLVARAADRIVEERWEHDGMSIHLDRLPAPDAPAKILLVHGAGAYGRIFLLAGLLAARDDIELLAPDLPGYGLSDPRGRVVSYEDWIACVAALIARERARDARPIFVFGGSMGGLIAYAAAVRAGADGLIATCFLDPRQPDVRRHLGSAPWMGALVPLFARVLGLLPGGLRILIRWVANMAKIANVPAMSALCASDPLGGGGKVTLLWLRTFLSSVPEVEPEDFTTCPVLLVHPANDAWTPTAISRPFFDRLGVADKRLVELEGCGHFPLEEPGLSQLEAALRAFVDARVAGVQKRNAAA